MDNKAYIVSQKVCPIIDTNNKCVYDTQGHVNCQGPLTEGAKEKQATIKTTTDKNEQLFKRLMDEKFTWR